MHFTSQKNFCCKTKHAIYWIQLETNFTLYYLEWKGCIAISNLHYDACAWRWTHDIILLYYATLKNWITQPQNVNFSYRPTHRKSVDCKCPLRPKLRRDPPGWGPYHRGVWMRGRIGMEEKNIGIIKLQKNASSCFISVLQKWWDNSFYFTSSLINRKIVNTVECQNPNVQYRENAESRTIASSAFRRLDFGHSGRLNQPN